MEQHPIKQDINCIVTGDNEENSASYQVGLNGVTRIEATQKCGEYADIPYVRVWKGDIAVAEFCQHKLLALYFKVDQTA